MSDVSASPVSDTGPNDPGLSATSGGDAGTERSALRKALLEVAMGPLADDDPGSAHLHAVGEPAYVLHLDGERWVVRGDDLDHPCQFEGILAAELVEFVNVSGFGFHGSAIDCLSPGDEILPVSEVLGTDEFDDGGVTAFWDVSHPSALRAAQFSACLAVAVHGTGRPTVYLTEAAGPVRPWPEGVAARVAPRQTIVSMIWSASGAPADLAKHVEEYLASHSGEEIANAVAGGIGRSVFVSEQLAGAAQCRVRGEWEGGSA